MRLSDSVPLASGIPLPTDSGRRTGMRRRFLKKARQDQEPAPEAGGSDSDILTEPHVRAPVREPTLTLDTSELEYIDTPSGPMAAPKFTGARREESVLFQIPKDGEQGQDAGTAESSAVLDIKRMAAGILGPAQDGESRKEGRESSVLLSLAGLQEIGEARAEEEKAGKAQKRDAASRESSVALSLTELQHIESERVALEMAKECSDCFGQLEERLSELNGEHVEAERGYAGLNLTLEKSLVDSVDSLAPEYRALYMRLEAAKARASLRPGQEGYLALEELKKEFEGLWNGINAALLKIDGCRSLIKEASERLPELRRAAEEEAGRKRAEAQEIGAMEALVREPSAEIPVEHGEPEPAEAQAAPEKPKGRMGRALSRFATMLGFGGKTDAQEPGKKTLLGTGAKRTMLGVGPASAAPPAVKEDEETGELSLSDIAIEPEGLPWDDRHARYSLEGDELILCETTLEERKVYWILPVPSPDEANAGSIIAKFKDDAVLRLGGKRYFIFPGEEGFAGARMASRVGDSLHIWPQEMTDYEYLGSLSIQLKDPRREETRWPEKMSAYMMSMEECAACNYFLPENNPRWLHPVPREDTMNEADVEILRSLSGTQQITLNGLKFYVLNIATVSDWREMVLYLPKARIATRHGNWLSVWDEDENGRYMFFNSGSHSSSYYGPKAEKSLREAKEASLYHSEELEAGHVFDKMGQVWLFELDDLPRMSANELGWIVKSANSTVQKHGMSPLISAEGRWYVALDIFVPDSMRAELDGSKVRLAEGNMSPREMLAKMKARLASKSASGQKMSLPPKVDQKQASILALPEGQVKHLLPVDPDFTGELLRPWLPMTVDGKTIRLLILDEPHQGAMAVVRKGSAVFFAKTEGQDGDEVSLEIALD